MTYLESLFGLDEHRTQQIIKLIMHYIRIRVSEGQKNFSEIEAELLGQRERNIKTQG